MRTYLYISDSKVAQFVGQLGKDRKTKLAAKLGVAVGVLTAGVSAEAEWKDNRMTLLEAAEKLVRDEEPIGPLDSDYPWIEGTADVVGETFEDECGGTDLLFYFTPDQNHFLGLAGSAHNVIGATPSSTANYSVSHLPDLLKALENVTDGKVLLSGKPYTSIARHLSSGIHVNPGDPPEWPSIFSYISNQFENRPRQRVNYLARRLTPPWVGSDGRQYTLATPLYLTLA